MRTIESTIAAHEARNRVLLESLRSQGADLFEKRLIDLHFWVETSVGALGLADVLGQQGFVVSAPVRAGAKWSVEAQLEGSIAEVTAAAFVERYVSLAGQHSAELDGWGTSV